MRLGTVRVRGGSPRLVGKAKSSDLLIDVAEAALDFGLVGASVPTSLIELLEFGKYGQMLVQDLEDAVDARGDLVSAPWAFDEADVTFMAPVPRPSKVICVGGNRKGSLTRPLEPEIQDEWPRPMYFMKANSAIGGHRATVEAWQVMRPVHTEGEVCLVIGKQARHVEPEDAWSVIAGVSLLNDMFAGRFVKQDGTTLSIKTAVGQPREAMVTRQMVRSKSPDGMCPIGPWVTPLSDITIPFPEIRVTTKVGANIVQAGVIDDYEFTAERTIAEITKWITLEPGDIVSLGAFTHQPDHPLRSVDLAAPENRIVTITADELGSLETNMVLVDEFVG